MFFLWLSLLPSCLLDSHYCSIPLLPWTHACLQSRYLATAVVYLLILPHDTIFFCFRLLGYVCFLSFLFLSASYFPLFLITFVSQSLCFFLLLLSVCLLTYIYCHVLGVCMSYKTGFEFDDRIYWTFVQLVTTFHKSLSSTGHSRLLTTLH
jgi:hypothetical protein